MKLRYFLKGKEKIYTLNQEGTHDAHYKFIKIKDAPKSDVKIVRKN